MALTCQERTNVVKCSPFSISKKWKGIEACQSHIDLGNLQENISKVSNTQFGMDAYR